MKNRIGSLLLAAILFFAFFIVISNSALGYDGFETTPISEEETFGMTKELQVRMSKTKTPKSSFIIAYSVSESGMVACSYFENIIEIYNPNNEFIEEISFSINGMYGISWNRDNILIFPSLSDNLIIEIDLSGNIISLKSAIVDNENKYDWSQRIYRCTNYEASSNTYDIRHSNTFFSGKRVTEVVKISGGNETVIARSEDDVTPTAVVVCLFLAVPIFLIIVAKAKKYQELYG